MKVSIIGSGNVGAELGHLLAYKEFIDEIVLLDIDLGNAKGSSLDISHLTHLSGSDVSIIGTDNYSDIRGSDVVIFSAGAPRQRDDDRSDLLKRNEKIIKEISQKAEKVSPNSVYLTVTNPVDVMNYLVYKETDLEREKVIGMGGALDSARFSYYLSENKEISVSQVNGLVIGSHSHKMVPLPKKSSVYGIPCKEFFSEEKIKRAVKKTKMGGDKVIEYKKQSAYFAPSAALEKMIEAILLDKEEIYSASVYLEDEYGFSDISIGVPVVLGKNGVKEIVELDLSEKKIKELTESVKFVKENIKELIG